jgi:hypothetical protein
LDEVQAVYFFCILQRRKASSAKAPSIIVNNHFKQKVRIVRPGGDIYQIFRYRPLEMSWVVATLNDKILCSHVISITGRNSKILLNNREIKKNASTPTLQHPNTPTPHHSTTPVLHHSIYSLKTPPQILFWQ